MKFVSHSVKSCKFTIEVDEIRKKKRQSISCHLLKLNLTTLKQNFRMIQVAIERFLYFITLWHSLALANDLFKWHHLCMSKKIAYKFVIDNERRMKYSMLVVKV